MSSGRPLEYTEILVFIKQSAVTAQVQRSGVHGSRLDR